MGRQFTALVAQLTRKAPTKICAFPAGAVLFGIAAVFAACLWVISVVPPFVSLALTGAIAIAWCIWLEKHPDVPEDGEQGRKDRVV